MYGQVFANKGQRYNSGLNLIKHFISFICIPVLRQILLIQLDLDFRMKYNCNKNQDIQSPLFSNLFKIMVRRNCV